jgi:hypothetical protein
VGEQELQHHNAKVKKFTENKSAEVDVVSGNKKFHISITYIITEWINSFKCSNSVFLYKEVRYRLFIIVRFLWEKLL